MNAEPQSIETIRSAVDHSNCEREPIHSPGTIQPHGVLFAVRESDLTVTQVSVNCKDLLGLSAEEVIGIPVSNVFAVEDGRRLAGMLRTAALEQNPLFMGTPRTRITKRVFTAIAHRYEDNIVVELEPSDGAKGLSEVDFYTEVRAFILRLKAVNTLDKIAELASEEIRRLTGYDHVFIYKFDENWNGHVIGESRDPGVNSYLDLWFPASDTPPQARQLFQLNRVRLIVDSHYSPVQVVPETNPETGKPLDMSHAVLGSASPIHVEYLHNMSVASSMSISLLDASGNLWGLIACHHRTPRNVTFMMRTMCDLIAQALSIQIEAYEQRSDYEQRIRLKSIVAILLGHMAQEDDVLLGLTEHQQDFLAFGNACGGAVINAGACTALGECPSEEDILRLANWLDERGREDVYHTDCLPLNIPNGEGFREHASGVLAISISQIHRSYLMWFRPEVVRTVNWGGDPQKAVLSEHDKSFRIHPRRPLETFKEIVRSRSLPWNRAVTEAAVDLRNAAIDIVLRKAEEMAELSAELKRSNKELEAFSYSVSHDLRAPFRHIVGYAQLLKDSAGAKLDIKEERYLGIITQSAQFAGTLVDNLLSFSQVGRAKLRFERIDMNRLVESVRRDLDPDMSERVVEWKIGNLPDCIADSTLIRLVWQNLLENALKYTRGRNPAIVEIKGRSVDKELEFSIEDNGVGFEQAYVHKLFGVFQRLHRVEEFEGTGIGLANVRRIISRHGGRTWAEGEPDRGARFFFTLPRRIGYDGGFA